MAKILLLTLFLLVLCRLSFSTICSRFPLCYCTSSSLSRKSVFCLNVTNLAPVQNLIARYPNIYSLKINGLELTDLPSKAFQGHVITVLGITARLMNVRDDALENIFGLQIVNFQNCQFATIPRAFSSPSIRTVQLVHGMLAGVEEQLQNNTQMTDALLYNNRIMHISSNAFLNANALQYLNLSSNLLVDLDPAVFEPVGQLKSIDLSNNRLLTVDGCFDALNPQKQSNLLEFYLLSNPWSCDCRLSWILDWIKVKGSDLEDEPICQSPSHLQGKAIRLLNQTDLDFWQDNCPQVCSCNCTADGFNVYTTIDCSSKSLDKIPEIFPANAKEIDLQGNDIASLDGFKPNQFLDLQVLNFENNRLLTALMDLPPSVKILKLASNNLTRFPFKEWNSTHFDLMTLSHNPWICDCETWNFKEWLIKNKESVTDIQEVRCNSGGKLSNKVVIQLSKQDLCPTLKNKTIIIIAVVVLFVVLCICCCIFRKALIVLGYSCGCSCVKDNEKGKYSFDAFLLYADEDEDVALGNIAEGLEHRIPGISLFIPTREVFLSSSSVNTESSLADCCKVIVLLTREFIKNDQCMQLLKASMACSIEISSKRMIFLIRDQKNLLSEADITLRAIIKNSVSLRYGEILFWQKLKYYLPKKNRNFQKLEESESFVREEDRRCSKPGVTKPRCPNCKPTTNKDSANFSNISLHSCCSTPNQSAVLKLAENGTWESACADTGASHTIAGEALYLLLQREGANFQKTRLSISLADGQKSEMKVYTTSVVIRLEGRVIRTPLMLKETEHF
ncbi:protein toll [Nephila pilipes]|uniref:Protein toll n=1 Tax=Nephila pilipes TaxID=299642 RepID=A0A8X6NZL4_NEPPI|nr:protein toll [Nephila pilipes]